MNAEFAFLFWGALLLGSLLFLGGCVLFAVLAALPHDPSPEGDGPDPTVF